MSNFEIFQLVVIQIDNVNSIITIFMSALFAYFMLSQFFATKLSKSQIIIVTVVYSIFMFFEVTLMASNLINIYGLQIYLSYISGGVLTEPRIYFFMILPFVSLIAWGISIVYMWTSSRGKLHMTTKLIE